MGRVSIQVMGCCKEYDFCVFICTVTSIVTLAAVAGKPSALREPGFESGLTLGLGVLFSSVNFARSRKVLRTGSYVLRRRFCQLTA